MMNKMDGFLILNKEVDQSVLKEGFSIPNKFLSLFFQELGFTLHHGEARPITLLLDGQEYTATFKNLGFDQTKYSDHTDILQIRYSPGSPLAVKLRECFASTQSIIVDHLSVRTGRKRLVIPEEQKEYLTIYSTPIPGKLLFDCMTAAECSEARAELKQIDEWTAETITDPEARIVTTIGAQKVRHLSKAVGNSLKLLYDFRCQICGQKIGVPYGSSLIHAHHIDYFVKSMNNDSSNILIVCPNHHAVIHDMLPVFDRKRLQYHYPNGYSEGLALNQHLLKSE